MADELEQHFETPEDALRYLEERRMNAGKESLFVARLKVLKAAQQHGWIPVVVAVQRAESADKQRAGTS